jgi:hypothetical protein
MTSRRFACIGLPIGLIVLAAAAAAAAAAGGPGPRPVRAEALPGRAMGQTSDEAQRLAGRVRDRMLESRGLLDRYGYFEEDTEIQLDPTGAEEGRETRVYVVSPAPQGGVSESRLLTVNGKEPSQDEREEDEERRGDDKSDASRESRDDRQRRRREAVEDLRRGLTVRIAGHETVDGHQTTILAFEPRPGARLESRLGLFIRAMRGRIWVTAAGELVQVDAELVDNVSVGWGLIARIWKGSSLRARQQLKDGAWLPYELNAQAQGRTLLFRTFRTRYAVKFWGFTLGATPTS